MGKFLSDLWDKIVELFEPSTPGEIVIPCGKTIFNIPHRATTPAFQHDPSGKIIAKVDGAPFAGHHVGAPGETFVLQRYDITLRDGTTIPAYKSLGRIDSATGKLTADPRMGTDCHGLTFTNGEYWINDPEVDALLAGGGYHQLHPPEQPAVGDVLIYRDSSGNVVHSVTVTKADSNGNVGQVSGLGGLQPKEHVDTPDTAWPDPKVIEYWRQ